MADPDLVWFLLVPSANSNQISKIANPRGSRQVLNKGYQVPRLEFGYELPG
jgi:hypothetical protein